MILRGHPAPVRVRSRMDGFLEGRRRHAPEWGWQGFLKNRERPFLSRTGPRLRKPSQQAQGQDTERKNIRGGGGWFSLQSFGGECFPCTAEMRFPEGGHSEIDRQDFSGRKGQEIGWRKISMHDGSAMECAYGASRCGNKGKNLGVVEVGRKRIQANAVDPTHGDPRPVGFQVFREQCRHGCTGQALEELCFGAKFTAVARVGLDHDPPTGILLPRQPGSGLSAFPKGHCRGKVRGQSVSHRLTSPRESRTCATILRNQGCLGLRFRASSQ